MDEPSVHCTKCNKPDRERQILYSVTYMWNDNNEKVKLTETESGIGCCQGISEDDGERLVKAYKLSAIR